MPDTPRAFVVKQYVYDRQGERNEHAETFDDLVTHHPRANRNIRMQDGEIAQAEDMQPGYRGGNRSYAFIGGEFQEVIDSDSDRYRNLGQDQVLVSKDFIIEDPDPPAGRSARAVDVPSPVAGYVNAVNRNAGFVEIMDQQGGEVIARVRHMSGVTVNAGDTVEYGQALGTQNNSGLNLPAGRGVHVHLDMDTRYYQQYENYILDLSEGRLPVQAEFREGLLPRPTLDDNVARLGESSDRVRDVQMALSADGYRTAGGGPIEINGVYRPEIQGAVIAFQQDHGLLQTGDIDLATWQQATHINQRLQMGGAGNPQPQEGMLFGDRILEGLQNGRPEALAPGDPRYGLRPPSDPARTEREPQWTEHADHTQQRDRANENAREPVSRQIDPQEGALPEGVRGPAPRQSQGALDPEQEHGRDGLAMMIERLSPQDRDVFDRGFAAVQARGGYSAEQARNIAAAGVLAFNDSRSVREAQDVNVYGDRLRTTYFPYGQDKEPNFPVDVKLADAAQLPAERSLQQAEQIAQQRAQEQTRQQEQQLAQGQQPSGPSIGARALA